MRTLFRGVVLASAMSCLVAAGCDDDDEDEGDAGRADAGAQDAGRADAGADAGLDAGADAGLDAGADAGLDAGADAGLFDAGVDAGDGGGDAGDGAVALSITLSATEYAFEPAQIDAQPGESILIRVTNDGEETHSFEIDLGDENEELEESLNPGETGTLRITAPDDPGTYDFWCPIGNHRALGMEGELVVEQ